MGYARGVRHGHAGGHLREPLIEALEWQKQWWGYFGSQASARRHVGRLWHCTDIVPTYSRSAALLILPDCEEGEVITYGRLARRLLGQLRAEQRRA